MGAQRIRSRSRRRESATTRSFEAGFAALERQGRQAKRLEGNLIIEEGGFGKGIGLDRAIAALELAGATRALIDLGGEVALLGEAEPFRVGVADPRVRDREVLELSIARGALATSGNSERGIVVDGVAHGHLLDPRSGHPVRDFGSLTVWAPDAMRADCLSTGLYVMGPDEAFSWVAERSGIELLVLEPQLDGALRARATAGLARRATVLIEKMQIEIVNRRRSGGTGFRRSPSRVPSTYSREEASGGM